jgi:hypothetical protein
MESSTEVFAFTVIFIIAFALGWTIVRRRLKKKRWFFPRVQYKYELQEILRHYRDA